MRHDSLPADPLYDPRLPFWTLGRHKSLLLSRQRCTTLIRKPGESTLCTAMPPPRTRAGFLKDSPGPDYPATNRPSGENSSDFQCFLPECLPQGVRETPPRCSSIPTGFHPVWIPQAVRSCTDPGSGPMQMKTYLWSASILLSFRGILTGATMPPAAELHV